MHEVREVVVAISPYLNRIAKYSSEVRAAVENEGLVKFKSLPCEIIVSLGPYTLKGIRGMSSRMYEDLGELINSINMRWIFLQMGGVKGYTGTAKKSTFNCCIYSACGSHRM